jgi:GT2 family glycosyltransferase
VRARQVAPLARWVQFVDGDCELIDGWILAARTFLDEQAEVACVCGVLRERFPEHSIYNRIADQAVTLPSGPIEACGGIVMLRVDVLERVGLFREDLVAGEEPELCVRLRRAGWKVWRLSIPMAWHDSAMTRFGQWWRRTRRVGYAYAQAVGMYGLSDAGAVRRAARAWIWGAVVPLGVLCAVAALGPWAMLLLLAYPLQILRSAASMGGRSIDRLCSAGFMMLGKFPELLGQCQYFLTRQGEARSNAFHKS